MSDQAREKNARPACPTSAPMQIHNHTKQHKRVLVNTTRLPSTGATFCTKAEHPSPTKDTQTPSPNTHPTPPTLPSAAYLGPPPPRPPLLQHQLTTPSASLSSRAILLLSAGPTRASPVATFRPIVSRAPLKPRHDCRYVNVGSFLAEGGEKAARHAG